MLYKKYFQTFNAGYNAPCKTLTWLTHCEFLPKCKKTTSSSFSRGFLLVSTNLLLRFLPLLTEKIISAHLQKQGFKDFQFKVDKVTTPKIAKRNNRDPGVVEKLMGKKLIEGTKPGNYYMAQDVNWVKR